MAAAGHHRVEAYYPRKLLYSRELHGARAGRYSGQQVLRMSFEEGRVVLRICFRKKTSYTVTSCEPARSSGSYFIRALDALCLVF